MHHSLPEPPRGKPRKAVTPYLVLACGLHALALAIPLERLARPAEPTADGKLLARLPTQAKPPASQPVASSTPEKTSREARPKVIPEKTIVQTQAIRQPSMPALPATAPPSSTPAESTTTAASTSLAVASSAPGKAPVMSAPRFDAAYLNNPSPAYPALSRRYNETGKVLLKVRVSPEGLAVAVDIAQSSNSARLDEAARQAVSRWRFIPARLGEQAMAADVLVPIVFRLDD